MNEQGPPSRRLSKDPAASLHSSARKSLEWSRVHLQKVLNALPQYVYITDEGGRVEFVNEPALAYMGTSLDDVLGERWAAVVHPEDLQRTQQAVAAALQRGERYEVDLRVRRHDGAFRWFLAQTTPQRNAEGQITHWVGSLVDWHNRKAEALQLQESERRFRQLVDAIPHAIWTAAPGGRSTYINKHWRDYTGLSASETRDDYSGVIHPDDMPVLLARWEQAMAAGKVFEAEYRVRRKADGAFRWHLGTSYPVRDAGGRIVEWVGSATDIDDRKRAEEGLREHGERLRAALEASGTGTFRWEFATDSLIWDESLDRLFGLPPGETARSIDQFVAMVHPDDRRAVVDACARCRREGGDFNLEFRVVHPDGSIRWLDDHGKTFPDPSGKPAYMTGACVDITDRKAAEEDVRQSNDRFRQLVECIPQVVWTAGPDGEPDFYNRRWSDFTGLPLEETMGLGWQKVTHPEDMPRVSAAWRAALATGENYDIVFRCRNREGIYRWLQVRAQALKDEAGRVVKWYGTVNDIHDQRVAEEGLRRARAEAEGANRAKDQFLAALSHELRTPLNPALLVLSSLLENPSLPEALRDEVLTAKRNIEIETHLIDDLLDVTRITQGKLHVRRETVAIHELLRHAWNACTTGQSGRHVELRWDLGAQRQHVAGDPARLQQVFWNLLKNALKFTPDGGTITISTENPSSERVRVTIRDNGIGIGRDALRKIFAPFEQGTATIAKVFGGLGLGLAIARGIVDLHHGTISAHSDGVGKGAAFTIELATTVAPVSSDRPNVAGAGVGIAVPKRILLVEDHEDTARTMMRILRIQGHTVHAARTKAEAVEQVARLTLDAVITDLGLPDGSGRDLIRQLRSMHPRLPVIALSGFGMPEDIEASLQAGAMAHITKPIDLNRLRETLQRIDRELV